MDIFIEEKKHNYGNILYIKHNIAMYYVKNTYKLQIEKIYIFTKQKHV